MRAAVLHEYGTTPQFGDFDDPATQDGSVIIDVKAAGLNHVDLMKASGKFYAGSPTLPSVVGSDGVGMAPDGRRVFFDATVAPFGSMADRVLVPESCLIDVAEGADDAVAAALGNTGLAGWLSVSWRAALQPGETVLVLGATGAVGNVAVQAAKLLGARKVVAADLAERLAGASVSPWDECVRLDREDDLVEAFRSATEGGPDVIIDPLWGAPAYAAMSAAARGARHVQIGHMASPELTIAAPMIRSAGLEIRGFVYLHAPIDIRRDAYSRLTAHAASEELAVHLERVPLADIAIAWDRQKHGANAKLVITPE